MRELVKIEIRLEVRLTHLFLCREYPPAPHPPGGIGTYVQRIAGLLASAGETVHVISQRWSGAPDPRVSSHQGRLVVHRVALDAPVFDEDTHSPEARATRTALLRSACPVQAFSWQAAILGEALVASEGIDVIESPEWEAPAYHLLARLGAAGVGRRRPICLVHLHSSTEQIYQANAWDRTVADFPVLAAREGALIVAADALLAPSQYVAEQACARYGLTPDRVTVVRYPLDLAPPIARGDEVWRGGAVTHVGRLEPRKGVLELAEAWSLAAPRVTLHLAGGDTPMEVTGGRSVGDVMRSRLGSTARRQAHFHGSLASGALRHLLAGSWAAVVPSRWDNLPYACLEAMASGLPIIASPHGGMKEIVEDGVSGWIADDFTPAALGATLRRAIDTPPERRREMGSAAAAAVVAACAPATIVRLHLETKQALAATRQHRPLAVSTQAEADDAGWAGPGTVDGLVDHQTVGPTHASAMARAVQRMHLPMRDWWPLLPASERRRLVATALSHPMRTVRQLMTARQRPGPIRRASVMTGLQP